MYFHITPPFHSGHECREAGSDHLSVQVDARWWLMLYEKRGSCGEWGNKTVGKQTDHKTGRRSRRCLWEGKRSYLKIYKKCTCGALKAPIYRRLIYCDAFVRRPRNFETDVRRLRLQFPCCPLPLNHSECISLSVFESFTSLAPEQHRDEAWSSIT